MEKQHTDDITLDLIGLLERSKREPFADADELFVEIGRLFRADLGEAKAKMMAEGLRNEAGKVDEPEMAHALLTIAKHIGGDGGVAHRQ